MVYRDGKNGNNNNAKTDECKETEIIDIPATINDRTWYTTVNITTGGRIKWSEESTQQHNDESTWKEKSWQHFLVFPFHPSNGHTSTPIDRNVELTWDMLVQHSFTCVCAVVAAMIQHQQRRRWRPTSKIVYSVAYKCVYVQVWTVNCGA